MKYLKLFEDLILKTDLVFDIHFIDGRIYLKTRDYEDDSTVIGYIHYRFDKLMYKKSLQIIHVIIYDKRKGYGDKLMTYMDSVAYENNCEFIHLKVLNNNIPAINLYKKHGFVDYKTDDICNYMFKKLD